MSYIEGKEYLEKGDYENAVNAFRKAIEEGDNVENAHKMLKSALAQWAEDVNKIGDGLYKRKNYKDAVEYYKKSIDLMKEAGNEKRLNNFTKEYTKAIEKLAQEINNQGDALLKAKKYKEAADLYEKSVLLMMQAGNKKKIENFQNELITALSKYAIELGENALELAKHDNMEEALNKIKEAKDIAGKIREHRQEIESNIEKMALKVYEISADAINKKGDQAFKKKEWDKAIDYYKESVRLIKLAKNDKKYDNYHKELIKAFTEHAEEINERADKAFKEKDYETAIKIYQESIDAAKATGNEKLVENYEKELAKSFEQYAKQINEKGDKLYKQKNFAEAEKQYVRSIDLAINSKKEKLVENFKGELRKTYEKWCDSLVDEGDDLADKGDFENAIKKYEEALKIISVPNDTKRISKLNGKIEGTYSRWASKINKEGDLEYKMDHYEKAYELYSQSVELAEKAKNPKLVKNFRKERDKALRKLQK
ncbi:MAG: tetratricopeptide repeat protein [Promethearchaeota archaeon]